MDKSKPKRIKHRKPVKIVKRIIIPKGTALCYPKELLGEIIPVDQLDHVIFEKSGTAPKVTYYCPSTGNSLTKESYKLAIGNAITKSYYGTDHTPFSFVVKSQGIDLKVAYLSLDCSERVEKAGSPLSSRLDNICEIVRKIDPDIIFFSEFCCVSNSVQKPNSFFEVSGMSSFEIRCKIRDNTKLVYGGEAANTFDPNNRSFGIGMYYKQKFESHIESIQSCHLSTTNACLIIKLLSGVALIGVHFPIDFVNEGDENLTGLAMHSLLTLLDLYKNAYAFGDMNTIAGKMSDAVESRITRSKWDMTRDVYTFLGGWYGHINPDAVAEDVYIDLTDEVIDSITLGLN